MTGAHGPELNRGGSFTDRLLTAADLAERWQVPSSWVYAATRRGLLPTVHLGRYYRFRLEAIREFEARGGTDV